MVSAPPPSVHVRVSSAALGRLGTAAVVLAALFYLGVLVRDVGAYAGGSDSSGYMNHARQLRAGQLHVPARAIPQLAPEHTADFLYSALGYRPAADARDVVPTYPAGLPLMLAAASFVVGWDLAAPVTMIGHALAGVLLTFAGARLFGLSRPWSAAAAAIVGGSPVYLHMTIQTLSDVPALVWTAAAVLAAWRSRTRRPWALAAGAAFAMAVLVRPTDLLALPAIAIALGRDWRRWVAFIGAGAPGATFFFLHNFAAYGKFLTTGYGEDPEIAWATIPPTLLHYARWLPILFTPVILGCFFLPWSKIPRRATAVLLAWLFAIGGFYAAYRFTAETWWYLRFILPIAPALVIGGLLGLRPLALRWTSPARRAALTTFGVALVGGYMLFCNDRLNSTAVRDAEALYPRAVAWLRERLPADAVILAMQTTGALHYYSSFTYLRWDQIAPEQFPHVVAAVRAANRPLYAVFFPFEIEEWKAFEQVPGPWIQIGSIDHISVWKWQPGHAAVARAPRIADIVAEKTDAGLALLRFADGWYPREGRGGAHWHWAPQHAVLELSALPARDLAVRIGFELRARTPRYIIAQLDGRELARFDVGPEPSTHSLGPIALKAGSARIEFSTTSPPVPEHNHPDGRQLGFALLQPRLHVE